MSDSAGISCPLDERGECAKEQKHRLQEGEELIRFFRKKEFRASDNTLKRDFLNPDELWQSDQNGWSFARKKDIASDARLREVARMARGDKPGAIGYVLATVAQIRQTADERMQTPRALGVIHDGLTYPEHVSVENCIALNQDDAHKLRNALMKKIQNNVYWLPSAP